MLRRTDTAAGICPVAESLAGLGTRSTPEQVGYEVSVVIPTYNESENISVLLERLAHRLKGVRWNVIFVDDNSPDGTAGKIKELAARRAEIQCIRRVKRRGLAGAVIEGVLASAATYVAVMDADLQHDEALLDAMYALLKTGKADVVVASRFLDGIEPAGLSVWRLRASKTANQIVNFILGTRLTDPMSGFFMTRRDLFEAVSDELSTDGFKILIDFIAAAPGPLKVAELPFRFAERYRGESKLDLKTAFDLGGLLMSRLTNSRLSPRFFLFSMVGMSGVLVHLVSMRFLLAAGFAMANFLAAITAMTSNYVINNSLTYRDRHKKGAEFIWGLMQFYGICALGLVANMAVATTVFHLGAPWWGAAIAGSAMGGVWNYATASRVVW
ncbi:MAG: glycosyltransferase family 2 protein [Oceanicaulis sp.]|nr:glycosyltransferase family 2 protein [Oceanicaulis sp.]